MEENISKEKYIDALKALIIADRRSGVCNIIREATPLREKLWICYIGGGESQINVTGNSLGAIGLEVFREIYGCGANGRVGGI